MKLHFIRRTSKILFVIALLMTAVSILPYLLGSQQSAVAFNQHFIDDLDNSFGTSSLNESCQRWLSHYASRLNSLLVTETSPPEFDDIEGVFKYVFDHLPYFALIHPTEMYYYFTFKSGADQISGNFRLVEADNGRISLGYFARGDARQRTHSKIFDSTDGLRITKLSERLYKFTYHGKTVYFRISSLIGDSKPASLRLLDSEEFISRVRDESGVVFDLLFNRNSNGFYYVLDTERATTEELLELVPGITYGRRTDFAYARDTLDRKVLFGVRRTHIMQNDYYDGPFDQVPPFLNLREKAYLAYPYTKLGGLDLFGNILATESTRVAISPYLKYQWLPDLKTHFDRCSAEFPTPERIDGFLNCLTWEEKREYHKQSKAFDDNGNLKVKPLKPALAQP